MAPGPPLWSIERGGAHVYLFGVRPGARNRDWLSPEIESALRSSTEFWRETPPVEDIVASPLLIELGLAPGSPLSVRLGPLHERLATIARSVGVEPGSLEPLRPWLAAQLIQQSMIARAGFDPAVELDALLTEIAEESEAAIRYEFGADSILGTFGTMESSAELDYLNYVLDTVEQGADRIDETFALWVKGDLSMDEADVADWARKYPGFYGTLLLERNKDWIPRIDRMLAEPGNTFIAAGTAHLVGPDGVPILAEALDGRVARLQ